MLKIGGSGPSGQRSQVKKAVAPAGLNEVISLFARSAMMGSDRPFEMPVFLSFLYAQRALVW